VYTDNIHALTARYFRAWAPLGRRDREARMALERETCNVAGVVFAKTNLLREALIEEYGCDPDRVVRVIAGANSLVPSLDGKAYDAQVALFVGIHFERKGGYELMQAWPLVRKRLPEAELWVVGPKQRPAGTDLPGIRWHGFVSDRNELAELYSGATAFVLPALFEPYGGVVMEAKGHGLPCIVTDRGGFGENIRPGEDGLMVPAGDPEALAEALVALLGDPERAERMGRSAHEDVLTNHTWGHVVDRMAPYLEAIATEGRSR
jgi:glycosyltransferase involved in cell wall biosynthesis